MKWTQRAIRGCNCKASWPFAKDLLQILLEQPWIFSTLLINPRSARTPEPCASPITAITIWNLPKHIQLHGPTVVEHYPHVNVIDDWGQHVTRKIADIASSLQQPFQSLHHLLLLGQEPSILQHSQWVATRSAHHLVHQACRWPVHEFLSSRSPGSQKGLPLLDPRRPVPNLACFQKACLWHGKAALLAIELRFIYLSEPGGQCPRLSRRLVHRLLHGCEAGRGRRRVFRRRRSSWQERLVERWRSA
mmetsp:Transcript_33963/g.62944  ORF Transcript_33963/g.62944 Transcript_33963/m.62944 type:complete len:247 (-) Transcript_33963:311-1051(-)